MTLFVVTGYAAAVTSTAQAGAPGGPTVCVAADFAGNGASADVSQGFFASRDDAVTGANQLWLPWKAAPEPGWSAWDAMGMAGTSWSWSKVSRQTSGLTGGGADFSREGGDSEFVCDVGLQGQTLAANGIFDGAKVMTSFAFGVRRFAITPTPVLSMMDVAVAPTNELYRDGYRLIAASILAIIGISLGLVSAVSDKARQTRLIKQAAVGAVFLLLGAVLMAPNSRSQLDPMSGTAISTTAPNYYWGTQAAVATTGSVTAAVAGVFMPDPVSGSLCAVTDGADDAAAILRQSDCVVYEAVIYRPWVLGQFGTEGGLSVPVSELGEVHRFTEGATQMQQGLAPATQVDLALLQMRAQGRTSYDVGEPRAPRAATPGDPSAWDLSAGAGSFQTQTQQDRWNILREYLYTNEAGIYRDWQGAGQARIPIALISFVTALAMAAFIILTSAIMLLWNVVLVVLFLLLPLCALLGAIPQLQRFFKTWMATWIKAVLWLVIGGIVQVMGMSVIAAVMQNPIGLGLKAIMIVLLLIGILMLLKKLHESGFTDVSLGADSRAFDAMGATGTAAKASKDTAVKGTQTVLGVAGSVASIASWRRDRAAQKQQKTGQVPNKQARKIALADRKRNNAEYVERQVQQGLDAASDEVAANPKAMEKLEKDLRGQATSEAKKANPTGAAQLLRDRSQLTAEGGGKVSRRAKAAQQVREAALRRNVVESTAKDKASIRPAAKLDSRIEMADNTRRQRLMNLPEGQRVGEASKWAADATQAANVAAIRRDKAQRDLKAAETAMQNAPSPLNVKAVERARESARTATEQATAMKKRAAEIGKLQKQLQGRTAANTTQKQFQ